MRWKHAITDVHIWVSPVEENHQYSGFVSEIYPHAVDKNFFGSSHNLE